MSIKQLLNVWIDWVGSLSLALALICVCKMHACMVVRYAITGYRVHIFYILYVDTKAIHSIIIVVFQIRSRIVWHGIQVGSYMC